MMPHSVAIPKWHQAVWFCNALVFCKVLHVTLQKSPRLWQLYTLSLTARFAFCFGGSAITPLA